MLYLPTVINASEVNNMHCQVWSYPKDLLLPQVKGAAGQPIDRGRQRMVNCTRGELVQLMELVYGEYL